jgi:TP901 family phage tail tape measure protein
VTVRLRADISQYTRNMRTAARNTSQLAGIGAAASTALVAGFAVAVASAAKFDQALSNVRAVSGASAAQMSKLRAAALEAGKTTSYTATQAADAEAELARAGVSVADITGGALKGSLALAASGQMDLADSAVIAAQAMNTFTLKGKDVTHIADVLSAGANKSAADMHGLGLSLRMGGLLAHQTGLSLEDTVGTLAAFADHALIGSDAGTSLKVMLQRLVPQSDEAKAAMDKIGFSAYDSTGKFVGLSELAGRMKASFKKLTPEARNAAMATIFGSDAVRSATILYELGSKGIDRYVKSVDDQGAAGRMASIQTDNLIGDLERLRGAIEVALIEGGSAANGSLRAMTRWVTVLVNAYNDLPAPLQRTVTMLGGVAGIAGLVAAGMLLMLPRIAAVRAQLTSMGITAAATRGALMTLSKVGGVLGVLAAVGYGMNKLDEQFRAAPPNVTRLTNSLVDLALRGKASGEAAKVLGRDLGAFGDAVGRIAHPAALDRIGDSLYEISHFGFGDDAKLQEARDKVKGVDEALASLVQSGSPDVAARAFGRMAAQAERSGTSTGKLRTLLPQYSDALAGADTQQKLTADGQKKLGDAAGMTADELQDQRTAAEKLTDALKTLNGLNIGAAEQEIAFRQSLADLTSAVKDNGHSLDVTSEKGRKVKSAFLDAAKGAQEHAQAVADQKGSVEAGNKVLEQDIGALKRTMRAAGFSEDAIRKLTSAYAQLPASKQTKVGAPGADRVASELDDVRKKVRDIPAGRAIAIRAPTGAAIKALQAAGYSVKRIPGSKKVWITVPTGGSRAAIAALQRTINALRGKNVTITTTTFYRYKGKSISGFSAGRMSYGGTVGRAQDGLYIPGYAPRRDTELILASQGEGVIVPETVRKGGQATGLGPAGFVNALNRWGRFGTPVGMRFADGGMVGYAKGGRVKKTPQSVINARRELPGDFGDFGRSLTKSASEIRSASKALATDLKKLGKAGWQLAGQVDRASRRLQSLANQRDKIAEQIRQAKTYAGEQRGTAQEFLGSRASTAHDVVGLLTGMERQQAKASGFRRQVAGLAKRGLHKDLLRQLIDEGPGGNLSRILEGASAGDIARLNRVARSGAKIAKSYGRTMSDVLYDSGKNAGKGFLAGLQSQEKALQHQMDRLGAGLVKSIRRALDSHSPSKKAELIGRDFGAGLIGGMDRMGPAVTSAAGRMSAATLTGQWGAPRAGATPGRGDVGPLYVQVHIGDREITDIARAEVRSANGQLLQVLRPGRRG